MRRTLSILITLVLLFGTFLTVIATTNVAGEDWHEPSAPRNLQGQATLYYDENHGTIQLWWVAPLYTGPPPEYHGDYWTNVTGYTIYRDGYAVGYADNVHTGEWYEDSGIVRGFSYTYWVTATNDYGTGPPSNAVTILAIGPPTIPKNLTAIAGDKYVRLEWDAPEYTPPGSTITGYMVHLYPGGDLVGHTTNHFYTDYNVNYDTTYKYTIEIEVELNGDYAWAWNPWPVTATPTRAIVLQATEGDGMVTLTWTHSTTLTNLHYGISWGYSSDSLSFNGQTMTKQFIIGDLENGKKIYCQIDSWGGEYGSLPRSNIVSATPHEPGTVPSAPTITNITASDGRTYMVWSTPTSDGGSPITGYDIYRSTVSGAETYLSHVGVRNDFTNIGLTNGVTYYYKIKAINAIGASVFSNEVSATPKEPVTVPTAPTGLTAVAGDGIVNLTWVAPTYAGDGITAYHLYRNDVEIWSGLGTTHSDTTVTNGVAYTYWVSAENAIGEGPNSTTATATPTKVETVPSVVRWFQSYSGDGFVQLNWTAPDYVGPGTTIYELFRDGDSIWSGVSLRYNDTDVVNGVTYSYSVCAINSIGYGPNSTVQGTPIKEIVYTEPSAPLNLGATTGDSVVWLTWTRPNYVGTGTLIYHVFRNGVLVTNILTEHYDDWTVVNDQTYTYTVTASNSIGFGPNSTAVTATPKGTTLVPPSNPVNLVAEAGDGLVELSWDAPLETGTSSVTSYKVYRATGTGAFNLLAIVSKTNYTDLQAVNEQEYRYKVSATSSAGEGNASDIVTATPTPPEISGGDDQMLVFVGAAGAALAVGGAGLYLYRRKKE